MIQIGKSKTLHPFILSEPEFRAETVGGPGGEFRVHKSGDQGKYGTDGHFSSLQDQVVDVVRGNSYVHNVCHKNRDDHFKETFNEDQDSGKDKIPFVGLSIGKNFFQVIHNPFSSFLAFKADARPCSDRRGINSLRDFSFPPV